MKWCWDGERVEHDLLAREWTQMELAERARVTPVTVSRLINGRPVGIKQVRRVARVFGRPARHYLKDSAETGENTRVSA